MLHAWRVHKIIGHVTSGGVGVSDCCLLFGHEGFRATPSHKNLQLSSRVSSLVHSSLCTANSSPHLTSLPRILLKRSRSSRAVRVALAMPQQLSLAETVCHLAQVCGHALHSATPDEHTSARLPVQGSQRAVLQRQQNLTPGTFPAKLKLLQGARRGRM